MILPTQQVVGYLAFLLALLALTLVARDIWQHHGLSEPIGQSIEGPMVQPQQALRYDTKEIMDAHILGQAYQKPKLRAVKAPPTRLRLKLVGIFQTDNEDESLALIETSNREQQVIKVGQSIGQSGASLSAVEQDYVLIKHNGKLEKLIMLRPSIEGLTQYN